MKYYRTISVLFLSSVLCLSCFLNGIIISAEGETPEEEAAEELPETNEGNESDDRTEGSTEEGTEEIHEDSEPRLIIEFAHVDSTWLRYDEKPPLQDVMSLFPAVLRIRTEDDPEEWTEIPVSWETARDYDEPVTKEMVQYIFKPVLNGYGVKENTAVPEFYVNIGDDPCCEEEEEEQEEPEAGNGLNGFSLGNSPSLGFSMQEADELPSYFNNKDILPPIRNQSPYGTCWAFANIGAVEADLITDGAADASIDFSEFQHIYFAKNNYTDIKGNHTGDRIEALSPDYIKSGGREDLSVVAFSNLVGPVNEADVPYPSPDLYVPDEKYAMSSNAAQVTGAYTIYPEDINGIKRAIMEHGGVAAGMYSKRGDYERDGETYSVRYNSETNAFYGNYPRVNHQIMLVGWDDSFSRMNFSYDCQPEQDGAWLVRNSWGEDDYCLQGYFWMSYEDAGVLKNDLYAYDARTEINEYCYSYDAYGIISDFQIVEGNHAVVSQAYMVDEGEYIKAVGVQLMSENIDAAVTVTDGEASSYGEKHLTHAGFYLIPLETPLYVKERCEITFTAEYTTSEDNVVIAHEFEGGFPSIPLVYYGEQSGPGFTVNGEKISADCRMKLYTDTTCPEPVTVIHQKETLEQGVYETAETEIFDAEFGTDITPEAKTYEGFVSPSEETVTVGIGTEVVYQYPRESYDVTVVKEEGIDTVSGDGSHRFEEPVSLAVTMKPGYEFDAWSGDYASGNFVMPAKQVTMRAGAKEIVYPITYDLNGGVSRGNPQSYTVTSAAIRLRAPARSGYEFTGWLGTGISGGPKKEVIIPSGSIGARRYWANWQRISPSKEKENSQSGSSGSAAAKWTVPNTDDPFHPLFHMSAMFLSGLTAFFAAKNLRENR